jgi:hypothetical protein
MLKERNWFLGFLIASYLVLLEALSWWASKFPPCAVASAYQRASYYPEQNACAGFLESVVRLFWFLYHETDHDRIIAAGTLLIAIFTWTLWRSTDKMWRVTNDTLHHAERTAERQLRAYVDIVSGQILDFGKPGNVKLRLVIKNSGQTPAYNLSQWTSVGADDIPPKTGFAGPNLPVSHVSTLAPGGFHTVLQEYGPLTESHIAKIKDDKAAIWTWGCVDYRDAFGHPRKTLFRLLYSGPGTTNPPGGMRVDREGNSSD